MKRILFVCTSNTCRSFLAEYIFRDMLEKADEEGKLNKKDYKVSSAGLFALDDDEPGASAVKVLEKVYGIEDSDKHQAHHVDDDMVAESDMIIAMTDAHQQALEAAYPDAENKTFTLNELAYGDDGLDGSLDIEDPYRGDDEDYEECACEIQKALALAFDKITLDE
ncbi:MAG: low molecular weight protein arginine phosphatase [Clostridiales bacterium]|nr:low molecular weight protein arginine phosphatase [Clostridiales bacterium]